MDKTVNVRMFEVEAREGAMPFSQALGQIATRPLAAREREIEPDIVIRLERLAQHRGVLLGEMVRRQTANLPWRARAANSEHQPNNQTSANKKWPQIRRGQEQLRISVANCYGSKPRRSSYFGYNKCATGSFANF
jgi:hypothetical protein